MVAFWSRQKYCNNNFAFQRDIQVVFKKLFIENKIPLIKPTSVHVLKVGSGLALIEMPTYRISKFC